MIHVTQHSTHFLGQRVSRTQSINSRTHQKAIGEAQVVGPELLHHMQIALEAACSQNNGRSRKTQTLTGA